jgi:hypothetical protein
MSNIEIVLDFEGNEMVVIDRGDGSFTSMLKSTYEAQQAEQSTPNLTL